MSMIISFQESRFFSYSPALEGIPFASASLIARHCMHRRFDLPGVDPYLSLLILVIPLGVLFHGYLTWRCSEFAVTDKRVLIKTGIVSRHTLETILTKIENIGVEQSIWGRLFNFGTLYVTGTGSTRETFPGIHAPLEFRKAIEAAAVAFEERRPSGRSSTTLS